MDKSREDENKNKNDNDDNDNHVMVLSLLNNTSNDNTTQFLKRKRTKRQRSSSLATTQPLLTLGLMGLSTVVTGGGDLHDNNLTGYVNLCTDIELYKGGNNNGYEEDEEEDLANCLILLAQGKSRHEDQAMVVNEVATRNCIYQCKTCDRCFTSFQALGGHRASHKKLKPNGSSFDQVVHEVKKKPKSQQQQALKDHVNHDCFTTLSLQVSSTGNATSHKSSKVHECSICGAEFSSGQALGGHMRRHRALLAGAAKIRAAALVTSNNHDHNHVIMCPKIEDKKLLTTNVFSLDLNLPATAEDQDHNIIQQESKLAFDSKEVIAFC